MGRPLVGVLSAPEEYLLAAGVLVFRGEYGEGDTVGNLHPLFEGLRPVATVYRRIASVDLHCRKENTISSHSVYFFLSIYTTL